MQGTCPICEGQVTVANDIEVSEVVSCSECNNQLVVSEKTDASVTFTEAPEVEEDWGE